VFEEPAAIRRAWIETYYSLKDFEFAFQYDVNEPRVPVSDAIVAYKGFRDVILTDIERRDGRPPLLFQGGDIQASVVLNDKGRPYRVAPTYGSEYGVFTGVTVEERQRVSRGGTGLFELGVRYSAIDLESREVRGGVEHDFTAGVNWYPEPNIRFVFDSIRSHAEPSAESLNFGRRTVDADLFIGRAQLYG
jgi:phosphate-selective porin OprO and OprP